MVGPWTFLSGCSGFDYATGNISSDVVAQAERTFQNIAAALSAADAQFGDVIRLSIILQNARDYEAIKPILRRYLGAVLPAATTWQAELVDPRMMIEVEATAYSKNREAGLG
jgi:enamine deaminase RidA (YjgF/YER057c/UK114 family)